MPDSGGPFADAPESPPREGALVLRAAVAAAAAEMEAEAAAEAEAGGHPVVAAPADADHQAAPAAPAPAPAPAPPRARLPAAAAALAALVVAPARWLLATRPRAAEALILCYVGALWASGAAGAALVAARWARGEGSTGAAAAAASCDAAMGAASLLSPLGLPLVVLGKLQKWWRRAGGHEIGSGVNGDAQPRRPASSWYGGGRGLVGPISRLPPFLVLPLLATAFFVFALFVGLLIQVLGPAKGSYQEKLGYAISDMANLIACIVICLDLFIGPPMIIQLRAMPLGSVA